ncbi:MAG: HAD hydrolase-like protein, partial [Candidatus Bipolaricaulis sp.]|nr:HAD hydrolase-like protein [Candidatus Bipolaricaulis sp.]
RVALTALGIGPAEALMIGDRLETDILGAERLGMDTALVLSGVSTGEDIARTGIQPTWVAPDLSALVRGKVLPPPQQ